MRRLDHSMIFVLIAGTYTPYCLLVLQGTLATVVLIAVWVGAAVGVATKLYRVDLHVLSGFMYIGLGWLVAVSLPALLRGLDTAETVLLDRRRDALLVRRAGAGDEQAEPVASHVRLPRGLAHGDDRGRGVPVPVDPAGGARPPRLSVGLEQGRRAPRSADARSCRTGGLRGLPQVAGSATSAGRPRRRRRSTAPGRRRRPSALGRGRPLEREPPGRSRGRASSRRPRTTGSRRRTRRSSPSRSTIGRVLCEQLLTSAVGTPRARNARTTSRESSYRRTEARHLVFHREELGDQLGGGRDVGGLAAPRRARPRCPGTRRCSERGGCG